MFEQISTMTRFVSFLFVSTMTLSAMNGYAEVEELDSEELDQTYIEGVTISIKPDAAEGEQVDVEETQSHAIRDEERFVDRSLELVPTLQQAAQPKINDTLVSLDGKALLSQTGDVLKLQFLTQGTQLQDNASFQGQNIDFYQQGDTATLLLKNPINP